MTPRLLVSQERPLFFFFFFLHVLCLCATLWVMTDLSVYTYKILARLFAHQFISTLSRHDIWGFSPPDSDLIWLNPQAVPPQPGHFFAAILAPAPSPLLFHPLRLISKTPIRDPSLSHWRATLLALFSQSSLAS